jgi:hypothetical protein
MIRHAFVKDALIWDYLRGVEVVTRDLDIVIKNRSAFTMIEVLCDRVGQTSYTWLRLVVV